MAEYEYQNKERPDDVFYTCLICDRIFARGDMAETTDDPGYFPGRDPDDKVGICIRCFYTPQPLSKVEKAFLRMPL